MYRAELLLLGVAEDSWRLYRAEEELGVADELGVAELVAA